MKRIKVFTRSFDLRLYRLSKGLFESLGYECVRLTDQSADGYFFSMLDRQDCDIAVNIDEDAFITDPQAVRRLTDLAIAEGYANIGFSDGDVATTHRDPVVTNPFFNVLNLELIRTKFDRNLIRARNFSDKEPYYPFFYWLAGEFKTLYLPCRRHSDGITTVGMDQDGNEFCLHTWFSRFYSMPSFVVRMIEPSKGMQKTRIDSIISEAYAIRDCALPTFTFKDRLSFAGNKLIRWIVKVPQRISRWPFKIRKKLGWA